MLDIQFLLSGDEKASFRARRADSGNSVFIYIENARYGSERVVLHLDDAQIDQLLGVLMVASTAKQEAA